MPGNLLRTGKIDRKQNGRILIRNDLLRVDGRTMEKCTGKGTKLTERTVICQIITIHQIP